MSRLSFSPERLTLGAGLVAVGVLWTFSNMGRLDLLSTLRTYWPLLLVLWGVLELVDLVLRRAGRLT